MQEGLLELCRVFFKYFGLICNCYYISIYIFILYKSLSKMIENAVRKTIGLSDRGFFVSYKLHRIKTRTTMRG